MASTGKSSTEDSRRGMGSPKPKSRGECGFDRFLAIAVIVWMFMAGCTNEVVYPENAKDTLCRNVTIYGRCRYEDKGARIPWSTVYIGSCEYNLIVLRALSPGCAFNHDPQKLNPANNFDRL